MCPSGQTAMETPRDSRLVPAYGEAAMFSPSSVGFTEPSLYTCTVVGRAVVTRGWLFSVSLGMEEL